MGSGVFSVACYLERASARPRASPKKKELTEIMKESIERVLQEPVEQELNL